jgi:hypothetical protein
LQLSISHYFIRVFYRGFAGLPCFLDYKKPLPFKTPNATLLSEWQNAGFIRCGPESQLQEVFWNTKQLLFVVVPSYLTACTIVTFTTRKKGQKKPS